MAGASLAAYGAGLAGHMLVKVLAPGYFARQDMISPVRFGVIAMVANMGLNLIFIWHFKHVGLAIATTISAFLNAALLYSGLRKLGLINFYNKDNVLFLFRLVLATLIMTSLIYYFNPSMDWWLQIDSAQRVIRMISICLLGASSYFLVLALSGFNLRFFLR